MRRILYFLATFVLPVLLLHSVSANAQTSARQFSDSIVATIIQQQPIPWFTYQEIEKKAPTEDPTKLKAEWEEIMATNRLHEKQLKYMLSSSTTSATFIHANPTGYLYQIEMPTYCISLYLCVKETNEGNYRVLQLSADSSRLGMSTLQLAQQFEYRNKDLSILYCQKALTQSPGTTEKITAYQYLARTAYRNGYCSDAIDLYNNIIETDFDTLLYASDADAKIGWVHRYCFQDELRCIDAEEKALNSYNLSISLYPNNTWGYIEKLNFYKDALITKEKKRIPRTAQRKRRLDDCLRACPIQQNIPILLQGTRPRYL